MPSTFEMIGQPPAIKKQINEFELIKQKQQKAEADLLDMRADLGLTESMVKDVSKKYLPVRKLTQGGQGAVYIAEHIYLQEPRVLKFLLPNHTDSIRLRENLERFKQEGRILASLRHPNILTVYDLDADEIAAWMSVELVKGQDLSGAVQGGSLTTKQITDVIQKVAQGLQAAHEKGILHRDIKPENILVADNDQVKLADFGLALLQGQANKPFRAEDGSEPVSDEKRLSEAETVYGTPRYLSPQLWAGNEPTTADDVFALGVTLYRAACGTFPSKLATPVSKSNPYLEPADPTFPKELADLMKSMMAAKPADRPELVEVIAELKKNEQIST